MGLANQGRGRASWRIALASPQCQKVDSCPEGNAVTVRGGVKKCPLSLSSPPDPSGLPPLGLFVSEFASVLCSLCPCPSTGFLFLGLRVTSQVSVSPSQCGHSASPTLLPSQALSVVEVTTSPPLSLTHQFSLSPCVSCLLMSLCLFCFPLHNLPLFPPLPSPQPACPSGWLGEGRSVGGGRG